MQFPTCFGESGYRGELLVPLPGAVAGACLPGKNAANPKNFVEGQYRTPRKQCIQTNYRHNAEITG